MPTLSLHGPPPPPPPCVPNKPPAHWLDKDSQLTHGHTSALPAYTWPHQCTPSLHMATPVHSQLTTWPHQCTPSLHMATPVHSQLTHGHTSALPAYTWPHQCTPSLHMATPVHSQLTHGHTSALTAATWTHGHPQHKTHRPQMSVPTHTYTHLRMWYTDTHGVWHANVLQPTCTCPCIKHMRVQLIKVECVVKLNRHG